ncbi:MAG TPA: inorganic diphosphatase [Eudoraea sp.]|nr:inorganic diphosphatase [Eudoraea sp.]
MTRIFPKPLTLSAFWLIISSCILCSGQVQKNYYTLPAFSSDHTINAVIEIPGGSNKKYEYDAHSGQFVIDQQDGIDRVVDFLPYPANYGFIPSTLSNAIEGGDGDALDVLLISESIATGSVVEAIPIAMLKLIDDGEKDFKIISVPARKELRIIKALTYDDLSTNYGALIRIIETWFLNYNPKEVSTLEGWGDEKEALREIQRHRKK